MKRDILLITNYWHFEFEKKSSRYRSMAEVLSKSGFDVEVVSSSFRHQTKTQRNLNEIKKIESRYKTTLLKEPGYKKNISLIRILSHHMFAQEIVKYLRSRKKPDLILVSVPSLSVGSAVTKFATRNNIKVVIDIQDLWPEAFKMAINTPILSDILFAPMMIQANNIYARADKIMAVSETYVNRALAQNKKSDDGLAVYIGTDLNLVAEAISGKVMEKPENEFWIGYVGALGHSYDIGLIIDALCLLKERGFSNLVFHIMGEGVLLNELVCYAKEKQVNCVFHGFVEYGDMMSILQVCDVAVNPIVGSSVSSIINKVSDYAAAGIPVINTQNSVEYQKLIDEYECGINCRSGDVNAVAEAIRKLSEDASARERMGRNSRRLAEEKFDRKNTYQEIINVIAGIEQ